MTMHRFLVAVDSKQHPIMIGGRWHIHTSHHGLVAVPAGGSGTANLETEKDLEVLLNDPAKFRDYIKGVSQEGMADSVAEGVEAGVSKALEAKGFAARPPGPETEVANPLPGEMRGAWSSSLRTPTEIRREQLMRPVLQRREAIALNDHHENFGDFLKAIHPATIQRNGIDEAKLKVLGEGQGDQGGFLVPDQYSMELLSIALETSVVRPRALTMPMTGLTLRMPAIRDTSHATNVFGGVQAYWTPESGAITASEPTFASVVLTAKKLVGYTTASNELLADSAIALEELIRQLFGPALAFFEDDAFINGVGGGQPLGLLNADALVTVAKETGQAATTIVKDNLDKMYSRMLPASQARAVWIAHPDTIPELFALSQVVGTGGAPVMVMSIADTPTFTIYGRPVIITEKCQTLGTAGDIFFVDFRYYLIGDRQALEMAASPHVRFTNDETVYRFVQRVDGRPWIDSALTPRNGSNTLTPFVNLATRS
jgi:HK97 family phage major capsid protein